MKGSSLTRISKPLAALLASLVLSLSACGDDDEAQTTVAGTEPDLERYCEIAQQLDAAGSDEFEALEQDPNATREDFEAAERSLVEDNEELLAEVEAVAPEEIQEDVEILIGGLQARAGLTDEGPPRSEELRAERAIGEFEKQNCQSP